MLATHFVSDTSIVPQTLYVTTGRQFGSRGGAFDVAPTDGHIEAAIIASEPLTSDRKDRTPVPVNYVVTVSPELHVTFSALD